LEHGAEPGALRAGAVRVVEGEEARRRLEKPDLRVVGTVELLGEAIASILRRVHDDQLALALAVTGADGVRDPLARVRPDDRAVDDDEQSEEHTSELQSR